MIDKENMTIRPPITSRFTRIVLGFVLTIYCISSVYGSECHTVSNIGREFYIGLPYINETRVIYAYAINILAEENGAVFVRAKAFHINHTYTLDKGNNLLQYKNENSDPTILTTYAAVLYMNSTVDVTVTVSVYGHKTRIADTYLAMPSNALSKEYIISSSKPIRSYLKNQILIIGTKPNTVVTISVGLHQTIDRFQAAILDGDESGVKIVATEPVAVLSASKVAHVPDYYSSSYGAEPNIEMLLPNYSGGKFFTVPQLPGRQHYFIKIYPIYNHTNIRMWNNTSFLQTFANDMFEHVLGDEYINILVDKPVLVYQYAFSSGNENPDFKGTFLRSISAHEHFVSSAEFVVQRYEPHIKNYLQIITKNSDSIFIDGNEIHNYLSYNTGTLSKTQALHFSTADTYSMYIYSIDMDNPLFKNKTIHKIHSTGTARFSALITGYASHQQSAYGQQLAIQFNKCSNSSGTMVSNSTVNPTISTNKGSTAYTKLDTITFTAITSLAVTSPVIASTAMTSPAITSTAVTSTAIFSTNTTHLTSTTTAQGYLCLQCADLTHIYLCNNFVRCSTSQVCFVDKYANTAGQTRYNVGCRENKVCKSHEEHTNDEIRQRRRSTCTQCCHGNFCNNKGCGADGLPLGIPHGPMCLTCQHALNVDECNTLSYCHQDEVCSIQVTEWLPGLKQLKLECTSKQCLGTRSMSLSRRSSILCEHCCSEDFCNHECTASAPVPAIVG